MTRFLLSILTVCIFSLVLSGCIPLPPVKQIAAGRAHSCALDSAIGGIQCWGDNSHGQTTVPTLISPRFVALGGNVSCAIANGAVKCWGDNSNGQLDIPAGLASPTQLAVGDAHVCALTDNGTVCWGDNSHGQLVVPALSNVIAIAAGSAHTCALANGGVHCWGDNSNGQLDAPTLTNPKQLVAAGNHNCVIDGGNVKCWGGDVPALIDQIPAVTQPKFIATGRYHSCVIDDTGVQCWGDKTIANALAPRELTNASQLAVGGGDGVAHACAHHQTGIACWGDDSLHQTEYNGLPYHVVYRGESEIKAPPSVVWNVLMDLANYPLWNPFTIEMHSTLLVGDPMVMRVKMLYEGVILTRTEYIRVLEPGHKACWGINTNTPTFITGERCQWLEALPDGGTHYVTELLVEGSGTQAMIDTVGKSTQTGLDGVAAGLKARAESLYAP